MILSPPIHVSASPAGAVTAGAVVTATWIHRSSPMADDWVGWYAVGSPDPGGVPSTGSGVQWAYTDGASTGNVPLTPAVGGPYEMRFYWHGTATRMATSPQQFTVAAAGPADTPWDTVTFGTGITFSGGNLTAVFPASNVCARSNNTKSAGKLYFNAVIGPSNDTLGAGNASTPLNSFLGSDNNSVALNFYTANQARFFNNYFSGTTVFGTFSWSASDEIGVAIDLGAQLIWGRNNTQGLGWTNATNGSLTGNPTTGVGGFSFTAVGAVPIYILASGTSDQITLHTASGTGAPPSGFSFWG